jgi:hypothetical protein
MRRLVLVILINGFLLALVACGSNSAETISVEPIPTVTALPATATLVPTEVALTVEPTPTATAVPATAVPVATETPTLVPEPVEAEYKIVGFSAESHPIEAWQIGNGPNHLIFVGGIHGGYEWNTVMLAYEVLDYMSANSQFVPADVTLTIIPVANPDGLALVTGTRGRFSYDQVGEFTVRGRFNADYVDVNRNWDCNWQPTGVWGGNPVSGGTGPFSEAESWYLNEYFLAELPQLIVFWHSSVPGIFPGACNDVSLSDTWLFGQLYADASGYPLVEDGFTAYEITGDASDYLNRIGIPSFTVELETRSSPETDRNLAGLLTILDYFR